MLSQQNLKIKMLLAGAILTLSSTVHADKLSVRVERPGWYKLLGYTRWNVMVSGEIDADAPARVAKALKRTGQDGAAVYFDSPGGNLFAGMKIGRIIREAGATTYVGRITADNENKIAGEPGTKTVPAGCYSACSLAFLGGVYRYTVEGSEYGVHRFSKTSGASAADLDTAQVVSATIANFIQEMEVDPGLFSLMASQGKDGIRVLTKSELTRLNVVNNGRKRPQWSIEAIEGGQYLRGVQENVYGQGKAVFVCINRQILMQSFYQIGAAKAQSVAAGEWYHSLLLDDETVPLRDPIQAKATGDEISTLFPLTTEQAMTIAASTKSIGHAMQLSRQAPTFVGFQIEVPASASPKISAFIHNCFRP